MPSASNALFRKLPSIDELMRMPAIAELASQHGASVGAVTDAAREVLARLREEIATEKLRAEEVDAAVSRIVLAVQQHLRREFAPSLTRIINATGVILHTNLGRAPLSEAAIAHIGEVARGYSNLEYDIETGERGKRDVHVQGLFSRLLNVERESSYEVHTVVVNNCAAAVMLALNSLAEGGEVIVSRGELVEIGGSFRVPDVMAKSQATLREVGTTNRTRIADYEKAINEKTRLLLRVHRSNFAIVGFTEQPSLEELVALGRKHKIPVLEDLGNGALVNLEFVGVTGETGVAESIRAGVDVITYSGDKLLGGPQAGMLSGRPELIAKIRSNPMFRALRVGKLTYAALEATLMDYLRGNHDAIPALRMMRLSADEIRLRAESLSKAIGNAPRVLAGVIAGESIIGGGTAPTAVLPTFLVTLTCANLSADELLARLRSNVVPIAARVEDGRVVIDLRTVLPGQDRQIAEALAAISA
ncbi:MAG: L-seryl-tRNA(Sec) selenium transferase [Acidobacteriales bacterium]|nr:L-seryl-tRNA(Sec) selenium transferase [Terriglobales bacterium]